MLVKREGWFCSWLAHGRYKLVWCKGPTGRCLHVGHSVAPRRGFVGCRRLAERHHTAEGCGTCMRVRVVALGARALWRQRKGRVRHSEGSAFACRKQEMADVVPWEEIETK